MNVNVVNVNSLIVGRMAQALVAETGWKLSREHDANADLNYYMAYRGWTPAKTQFAAYYYHRDVLGHWEPGGRGVAPPQHAVLRVITAQQFLPVMRRLGPTVCINPPVDREKFQPGARRALPGRPTIGVVGRVYGNGRKGEQLINHMLKTEIGQRFEWRGCGVGWPVPTTWYDWADLQQFYHDIDLYVCTSLLEGVPHPPLEALACGVPIVIPQGVGLLDELPAVEGIIRFRAGSIAGLEQALQTAMPLLGRVDRATLREITAPYTAAAWAEGHVRAFKELKL